MTDVKTRRHQNLRRLYEAAVQSDERDKFHADFAAELKESTNDVIGSRWSVAHLFEQFVGSEAFQMLRPTSQGGFHFYESAELIDTSAFANIIGQITYTSTLNGFNMPGLVGDQLVEVIPTQFSGEKIPGVGRVGDDLETVDEGKPYPNATFGEEYIETPETIKRGLILNVTREAIFFDRTGVLLSECNRLGQRVAVNREKRILDVVCGISTVYRRNGAAAVATYGSDNTVSNTLSDWTSIDAAQQKFNAMTDPITGEPIACQIDTVIVPKDLEMVARRIINASMIRQTTNSNVNTYVDGNMLQQPYNVVSGQYVKNRTSSATTWFAGAPKQAFVYMENWPLSVIQSNADSEVGFTRDIVLRYRASERGAAGVRERLYMTKNT